MRICRIFDSFFGANRCVVRSEVVGITRLKRCFSANQRPAAFHVSLNELGTHPFAALGSGAFVTGCATALDYMKRLLKGAKGAK